MSNKNYYDELARMSLIMSNAVSNGNGGVDDNKETKDMSYINTAMQSIGMNCEYSDVIEDTLKAGVAIGHNEVEYADIKKNVVLVAVSNARDEDEYCKFSDIGKSDWSTTLNSNHSKAHEILANEVYNRVKTYLTTNNVTENVVFWVTGYGTGGGIANLLSEKLIDYPIVSTNIELEKKTKFFIFTLNSEKVSMPTGMTNVYCYTFGAPNVVYTDNLDMGINNNKYKSIFNIVDPNDVLAHLPSTTTGWNKYGWNMILTEKAEKCQEVIESYDDMMHGREREGVYTIFGNDEYTIKQVIEYAYKARANNNFSGNILPFEIMKIMNTGSYKSFMNKYGIYYKYLESKHSIKNYYELCKKLLPENMRVGDGWSERSKSDMVYNGMKDALDEMGKWYVSNVYTYQVGSYGAVRYRTINVPKKNANDICRYIYSITNDTIQEPFKSIKSNLLKKDSKGNEYYEIIYEQEISLEDAKTELRKGIVQNDENKVTYYEGERYQYEFKHRFEHHLNDVSDLPREKRITYLDKNDVDHTLIYNKNVIYDVDKYIDKELVERKKGVARGKYNYEDGDKTIKVTDDCSGFAGAVFYKFIKDNDIDKNININDIWYSSYYYSTGKATKLLDYGFKCYLVSNKKNADEDKNSLQYLLNNGGLQYGDLVCANGHVEFYRDKEHTFGWGNTHNSYYDNEGYDWVWSDKYNCLYDSKLEKEGRELNLSKNDKYVAVYRYEE